MSLDDHLREHLAARANRIPTELPDVSAPPSHVIGAEEEPRSSGWIAAAAAAALVVVVGGAGVLGNQGSADLENEPSSFEAATTTSPPSTIAAFATFGNPGSYDGPGDTNGPPLTFRAVDEPLVWSFQSDIVRRNDDFHVLATSQRFDGNRTVSLRSTDGVQWTQLGTVIQDNMFVSGIDAADRGLLAVGIVPESDSRTSQWSRFSGTPTVASSVSGGLWVTSELPVDPVDDLPRSTWLSAVILTPDTALVVGQHFVDIETLLLDALEPAVRDQALREGYGFDGIGGPDSALVLRAPNGEELASFTPAELGLSDEQARAVMLGPGPETLVAWQSEDLTTWRTVELDGLDAAFIERAYYDDVAGLIRLFGWGTNGAAEWTSADGVAFERTTRPDHALVQAHEGRTFAMSWNAGVYERVDDTWLLASPPLDASTSWQFQSLSAGDGGIAALAGYDDHATRYVSLSFEVLSNEGLLVRFDEESGYHIYDDAELVTSIGYAIDPASRISPSVNSEHIIFTDTDGNTIATVPTDLLIATVDAQTPSGRSPTQWAVIYSPDGRSWSVNDLPIIDDRLFLHGVLTTDDQVVVFGRSGVPHIPLVWPDDAMRLWVGTPEE